MYNSLSFLPFPITWNCCLYKSISPTLRLHNSLTRTPVEYKNSSNARSLGCVLAVIRASNSLPEKAFLMVLSIFKLSILATGLSSTIFSRCKNDQKLLRYRIRPWSVTILMPLYSRNMPKYHRRSIVVISSKFLFRALRQFIISLMY